MEGVFGCGIFSPQKNIMNHHHHHHGFTPPLSAIDRFLCGQTQTHFSHQNNIVSHNKEIPISPNGLLISNFSSPPITTNNNYENGSVIIWPISANFIEGSETQNWDKNLNVDRNQEAAQSVAKNKKVRVGLIKGQWTDEEDRKLIRLVKQFGVRKWAQIAEKMFGRAGKQCRERWHNHLRPDIKKDSWSEEEERMLVEAHLKVGNKWADIAKGIPGRSENSIKNHWNATKRRQNSRRKSKKNDGKNDKSQQSLLQAYIRAKILEETNIHNSNSTTTTTTSSSIVSTTTTPDTTTTPTNSSTIILFSDDPIPSIKFDQLFPQYPSTNSLITPTSDEELNFMHRFLTSDPSPSLGVDDDGKLLDHHNSLGYCFSSTTPDTNYKEINKHIIVPKDDQLVALEDNIMLQADHDHDHSHYHDLSFLLDGSTPLPSNDFDGYNDSSADFPKKELDLIEMVLASQFSQGIN